jgi:hypothetical protein
MKLTLLSTFPLLVIALSQATEAQAQVEQAVPSAAPAPKSPFQTAYLRLNVGTTFDALKYYRCARVAVEYAPMLTHHVGLAGRLAGVAGSPSASNLYGTWIDQLPNQNYKAGYAEAEALYYPFGNQKRVRFAVGAGGFVGYYKKNSFSFANVVDNQLVDYQLTSHQGVHAGYLGSLNLEVALGTEQRWLVGLKATLQKGVGGVTDVTGQSLTLARRL